MVNHTKNLARDVTRIGQISVFCISQNLSTNNTAVVKSSTHTNNAI